MWTNSKVMDILENHEIELDALTRQLVALGEALDADLEEIRHRVYPGAVSYDRDRVQTTPAPADARLVAVVQACDERREQHKRDVDVILERIREIRLVYSTIQQLDSMDKAVLLNLYYPRRSGEEVAGMMGTTAKTINRRRDCAVEALKSLLWKKDKEK